MAQYQARRKRVIGSNVVYRTDSMMAVLVAAGLRRWDNRWLYLPWLRRAACVAVAGLLLSQAHDGFANPTGGNVVSGSATIASSGNTLQVDQKTKIVIIDWSKFDIAKGETTQFNQPGTSALAVNRIGSNDPSKILGNLLANGRIILINGNGILFGPSAKVDVGALIATTSDAANSDIASGKAQFDKAGNPNAMVVNQGSINAKTGMVGLVAPAVRNDGIITARLGSVTLGASNIFTIDFTGDGLISFPLDANVVSKAIDANGKPVEALVVNNGRIEGATVLLTARAAKDLVRNVISMGGTIAANKVTTEGGKVVLSGDSLSGDDTSQGAPGPVANSSSVVLDGGNGGVSVSGTIDVRGIKGGTINIKGGRIELAGATLDASGTASGGTIRIGGDATDSVSVDQASLLNASAVLTGNGGSIYVMSNATQFAGRAQAKGGAAGGNGGTVETSGHTLDIANASIDTSAVSGRAGSWLLDPDDYTIDATQASTIQTNLANGNVTIQTTLAGTGGNGDIFVNAPVSWSGTTSLTLSAYRNVAVNANIANTGGGAVTLYADNTGTGTGTVSFATGKTISTSGSVSIYYNPSVNPAGSMVNASSYANPAENYAANVTGGGTLTAYMLVNSVYDLQNIQNNAFGTYALGRDIDASGTAAWNAGAGFRPIGLSGIFDGQGHVIDKLTINATSSLYAGLFWESGGTIRNVGLANATITGSNLGAGAALGGLVGNNGGTISNAYVTGSVTGNGATTGGLAGLNTGTINQSYSTATVSGGGVCCNVGGLVGWNTGGGTVTQSYATGLVSSANGNGFVGGLVGSNDATITQSYASAAVTGGDGAGGLVGLNGGSITQSYATGTVNSSLSSASSGGLVGGNAGTISQSYATGSVGSGWSVGGLAGTNTGSIVQSYASGSVSGSGRQLGGLVGDNLFSGTISQSYATGSVSGGSATYYGGFVGYNDSNATITQSYWDTQSTGQSSGVGQGGASGVTGLTSAQARTQSSYAGWDFAGTWFMIDGETRPFLRSEYSTTITNAHQLQLMAMDLNANYTLANNIDLGPALAADANGNYSGMWGASGFVPVGIGSQGKFNGEDHTISNLMINRPTTDYVGLFGIVDFAATVENVGLIGGSVVGRHGVGGLAGINGGTITNSYTTGGVVTTYAGAGGLVGINDGTITQAYATGSVSGGDSIGGLVGYSAGTISDSYATGAVTGTVNWTGGLVGYNQGTVSKSYAIGTVSGGYAGGLVGINDQGTIEQSYSTGAVSGGTTGGLVGWIYRSTITQSYWDTQTSGQGQAVGGSWDTPTSGSSNGTIGITGLTSAQARTQSSYAGWDFAGTWFMTDGDTRPFLRSEYSTTITNAHQLQLMAMDLNANYTLANNIDLGPALAADSNGNNPGMWGTAGFVPIGSSSPFHGTLDGKGYTIGNLMINRPSADYIGLFSIVGGGAVHNVGLVGGSITGGNYVGGLVGYAGTTITQSYVTSSVTGTGGFVGGLVGLNSGGIITQSYATGAINGGTDIGGLVGANEGTVVQSYATGVINGTGNGVGGLAGSNYGSIANSYATGSVHGGNGNAYGGLVGGNSGTITQSYAIGSVSGGSGTDYGGFVGYNGGTITQSYWDSQTAGQGSGVGGGDTSGVTGVMTAQLASGTLPSGFDHAVWGANAGSYPCLLWQAGCSAVVSSSTSITYSVADSSSTYGTLATLGAVTLTGVSSGDVSDVSGVVTLYDTSNTAVSLSDALNAGAYVEKVTSLTGSAAPNYTIATTGNHDGTLTINPAPLIVAVNDASRVYGDANPAFTANITGFVLGQNASVLSDLYLLTSANETSNVAKYAITAAGVSGNYYIASSTNGTLSVTARPITVSANNLSRTYGDANPNLTYSVTSGTLVNDDTLAGTLATPAGVTANVGSYAITQGTLAASSNYAVTYQAGTLNVLQRAITVAADSVSRTYGNANPVLTYAMTSGNLVNGDSLSGALATSAAATSGVGNYAIAQGTLAATSNYALSFQPGTLTVTARPITVTANDASRLYGDSNPTLAYRITAGNLVNGDVLGGYLTTGADVISNTGSYAISLGTLSASSNYTLAFNPGTLTINPVPLTVAVNNVSRVYGDANPAFTANITGLKLGQDASVLTGLTFATAATQASNVGSYVTTSSSGTATNYYIANRTDGTLTVTARAITVTADNASRVYGEANPTFTYAVTSGNLVNGDALTGALATTATLTSNVGSYTIAQGTLAASSNYALTFQPGSLVISPRLIMLTADNQSRLYGDPNGALTYAITSGSLVNGDALTGTLATSAVQASDVGSYAITQGTLAASSNYALSFTAGTLTINPAPLSIAMNNATRLYGDVNPPFSAVITGLKLGQSASVLSGLTFSTNATQTSNVGTYAITSSGGTASNYTITSRTDGTLAVTARPITVAANNLLRVYGSANPVLTYSITAGSLANADKLSGALATSAVLTSNVGSYAITQGTLAASTNYALTFAPGTLTVLARPITIAANNVTRSYGDANPALTYVIAAGNLVNGDTLTGVLSTSAILTSNVGNYAITKGNLSAGSNYSLNFQSGTLSITPRSITVTANDTGRVYGDANPNLTYVVSSGSLVNGDVLSGALATSAVQTSSVGSYSIGQGTLAATQNYTLTFQTGTLAITARAITVTANNASRSYGDANPNLTYGITSGILVNGDTLTGNLATSAVQGSTVGNYAINQGTLAASSNYTVTFQGGSLTVTPAALTVSVNDASRLYGYTNPDFTATITGFKLGDDASVVSGLVFLTDAVRTSATGTYAIKSSGGTATNYVIVTRTDGTLTVEPLPISTTDQIATVVNYLNDLPAGAGGVVVLSSTDPKVTANFKKITGADAANDNSVSCLITGGPQCNK